MKFTEAKLEAAIIEILGEVGYPHVPGETIERESHEVLIKADLRAFLATRYWDDGITAGEIDSVIRRLTGYSAADLYESNKAIMKLVSDGILLKREDRDKKDLYVQLVNQPHIVPRIIRLSKWYLKTCFGCFFAGATYRYMLKQLEPFEIIPCFF